MSYETKSYFKSGNICTFKNFNQQDQLHGISIWYKDNINNEYESTIDYKNGLIDGQWITYHEKVNKKWTVDEYKNNDKLESTTYSEYDTLVEYKQYGEDGIKFHDVYCEIVYKNLPFKLVLKVQEWRVEEDGIYRQTYPKNYTSIRDENIHIYYPGEKVMFNCNHKL